MSHVICYKLSTIKLFVVFVLGKFFFKVLKATELSRKPTNQMNNLC